MVNIWHSLMTNTKNSQSHTTTIQNVRLLNDYGPLMMVSKSDNIHQNGVIYLRFKGTAFPPLVTVMQSKGQTIKQILARSKFSEGFRYFSIIF